MTSVGQMSENTLVASIGWTNSIVKVIVRSKAKNPGVENLCFKRFKIHRVA
jgi:hypothetical protein